MKLYPGHLTYCTNIHAGESWDDHFTSLKKNFPLIKQEVSGHEPMGIGLRLSGRAVRELQRDTNLEAFKSWLKDTGAYVFTMNGFPYGDFHHAVVKDQVHAPDWTTKERLDYTLRLFEILAALVPEGLDGGVSTSPLSYRHWFPGISSSMEVKRMATANIIRVAEELYHIKQQRGMVLHLDIEPEPDGMIESGMEFIEWYEEMLLPAAAARLPGALGINPAEAEECVREHIRLCYDICHFAIGYENHEAIINLLEKRGIRVGKIQISAALKADLPEDLSARKAFADAFAGFNEPVYLHQVVAGKYEGGLIRYRDMPEALTDIENPLVREWRAHYHVPVFTGGYGLLKSTRQDIIEVLRKQRISPFSSHLEVETYTWEVLPELLKIPVGQSISRELNWVREILSDRNE